MNRIKNFMEVYLNNDKMVNSEAIYYKTLKEINSNIEKMVDNRYIVKFSCGMARKAEVPWICIFNKQITKSAKSGIYIAILFKSDMTGLYLSLCQGMESILEKYGTIGYQHLNTLANYFRDSIENDNFKLHNINLEVKKGTRGYGYEQSNVIAKYYDINNFTEEMLYCDIRDLLNIYEQIYYTIDNLTYDEVVQKIILKYSESLTEINAANKELETTLQQEIEIIHNETKLVEISIPKFSRKKFSTNNKTNIKKIDYIKKAKKDIITGLKGEKLVLAYEKEKLKNKGREDLIKKIKRVSEYNDSLGYDILSYDIDENGIEKPIYIEVKTTEDQENQSFFISNTEYNTMLNNLENYWVYRVFNINKDAKFYKINAKDFNNIFNITVEKYIIELKNSN